MSVEFYNEGYLAETLHSRTAAYESLRRMLLQQEDDIYELYDHMRFLYGNYRNMRQYNTKQLADTLQQVRYHQEKRKYILQDMLYHNYRNTRQDRATKHTIADYVEETLQIEERVRVLYFFLVDIMDAVAIQDELSKEASERVYYFSQYTKRIREDIAKIREELAFF